MASWQKIAIGLLIALGIALTVVLVLKKMRRHVGAPLTVVGSVIQQNADTRKESPIADVEVSAPPGMGIAPVKSDFSGYFKIVLPAGIQLGDPIVLHFRHPDYKQIDLNTTAGDPLYVVSMIPLHGEVESELSEDESPIANVLVRYTTEMTTTENIGVGVKTFQVVNTGNVPCYQRFPCSPDGKWKAAIGSATLDAGEGNVFENARVSCIAGPCAFTKIESDDLTPSGRTIKVSVRNWSDTTTFLVQAEVFHTQVGNVVRTSYPVILGRSLNFTVPADAEGVTLEADINGSQIIFPLGPDRPKVSWADCNVKIESDKTRDYRCDLNHGYKFK